MVIKHGTEYWINVLAWGSILPSTRRVLPLRLFTYHDFGCQLSRNEKII